MNKCIVIDDIKQFTNMFTSLLQEFSLEIANAESENILDYVKKNKILYYSTKQRGGNLIVSIYVSLPENKFVNLVKFDVELGSDNHELLDHLRDRKDAKYIDDEKDTFFDMFSIDFVILFDNDKSEARNITEQTKYLADLAETFYTTIPQEIIDATLGQWDKEVYFTGTSILIKARVSKYVLMMLPRISLYFAVKECVKIYSTC
jgi:hypothetical protein